ncbi:hypothetical protein CYMTET_53287, partial [Cymbomonas tetramitiformis]
NSGSGSRSTGSGNSKGSGSAQSTGSYQSSGQIDGETAGGAAGWGSTLLRGGGSAHAATEAGPNFLRPSDWGTGVSVGPGSGLGSGVSSPAHSLQSGASGRLSGRTSSNSGDNLRGSALSSLKSLGEGVGSYLSGGSSPRGSGLSTPLSGSDTLKDLGSGGLGGHAEMSNVKLWESGLDLTMGQTPYPGGGAAAGDGDITFDGSD